MAATLVKDGGGHSRQDGGLSDRCVTPNMESLFLLQPHLSGVPCSGKGLKNSVGQFESKFL